MLILIDIGNTAIKFGFAKGTTILESFSLPSYVGQHSADSLGLKLMSMLEFLGKKNSDVEALYVSSVVPVYDSLFKDIGNKFFKTDVFIAGKDIQVPLENAYKKPSEVGMDRLMGAYAARNLYPDKEFIISIDFGTATTFDCILENKYLGGLICPGILSSHQALSEKAAKLPKIALEVEGENLQVGTSTATSISHGFVYGFSAMTEGLIEKISKQFNEESFIIATGGFAPEIAKHVTRIQKVEQNLILLGLALLSKNKK